MLEHTLVELKAFAKEHKLKGYSKMKKAELLHALEKMGIKLPSKLMPKSNKQLTIPLGRKKTAKSKEDEKLELLRLLATSMGKQGQSSSMMQVPPPLGTTIPSPVPITQPPPPLNPEPLTQIRRPRLIPRQPPPAVHLRSPAVHMPPPPPSPTAPPSPPPSSPTEPSPRPPSYGDAESLRQEEREQRLAKRDRIRSQIRDIIAKKPVEYSQKPVESTEAVSDEPADLTRAKKIANLRARIHARKLAYASGAEESAPPGGGGSSSGLVSQGTGESTGESTGAGLAINRQRDVGARGVDADPASIKSKRVEFRTPLGEMEPGRVSKSGIEETRQYAALDQINEPTSAVGAMAGKMQPQPLIQRRHSKIGEGAGSPETVPNGISMVPVAPIDLGADHDRLAIEQMRNRFARYS